MSESGFADSDDMENKRRSATFADSSSAEVKSVCPKVNCPEKIILCLDLSDEMEKATFRSRAGDKFAPIKLMKRALSIFLHSKHRIDRRHMFALVLLLHDTAKWMGEFSGDPEEIVSTLDEFLDVKTPWAQPTETFDLGSVFHEIVSHVSLPRMEDMTLAPPFIVRTILLYGRSQVVPKFENEQFRQEYRYLQTSHHFFVDAFYIHEPPSAENKCEAAFDAICGLDEKGLSYVFEVSRNPTKLYECMAKLLAHPLQRPTQTTASYSIERGRNVTSQLE